MNAGEAHVWRIPLDGSVALPPPTRGELARAARFRFESQKDEYLRSHSALRAILGRLTDARLDFAVAEHGKPYLPNLPRLKFNLSHSRGMALVGAALDVEIGVDLEGVRVLSDYTRMAEHFFPPCEAAEVKDERDFFRRWTRIEAVIKALGIGVYGAGTEPLGEWTIEEIDAGPAHAAAAALPRAGVQIVVHEFGGDG
jgi:4'-phosphopantetheinyl transferase